jgi:hypothetical protein
MGVEEVYMRAALLLPALLLAVLGTAAQESVKFNRSYKEGDTDRYTINLAMKLNDADTTIDMVMKQVVKKLYENGDADIETGLSDVKIMFMGSPMSSPVEPPAVQRVNKLGMPVGPRTGPKGKTGFEVLKLAAVLMDRQFAVGKATPIDFTDPKDDKSRVKGSATVQKVVDGVATVKCNLDVWNETTTNGPIKAAFVWTFDVETGKPRTAEGTLSNLPPQVDAPSPTDIKIKMARVLK